MAKAVIYSDEDVLAAQQVLRNKTARKVGRTRSQVAEFLADDIRKAIEQGYSLNDARGYSRRLGFPFFPPGWRQVWKGKSAGAKRFHKAFKKENAHSAGTAHIQKILSHNDRREAQKTAPEISVSNDIMIFKSIIRA